MPHVLVCCTNIHILAKIVEGKFCLTAKLRTWSLCDFSYFGLFVHFLSLPLEMDCDTPVHSWSCHIGRQLGFDTSQNMALHTMIIVVDDDDVTATNLL